MQQGILAMERLPCAFCTLIYRKPPWYNGTGKSPGGKLPDAFLLF